MAKISFLFKSKTISKDKRLELIAKGTKAELLKREGIVETETVIEGKPWFVAFEDNEGIYIDEPCANEAAAQKTLKELVVEDYPEDQQEAVMASCGLIFQAWSK